MGRVFFFFPASPSFRFVSSSSLPTSNFLSRGPKRQVRISTHSTSTPPSLLHLATGGVGAGVGRQREPLVLLLGRHEAPRLGGGSGLVLLPLLGDGLAGDVDLGRHLHEDRLDVDILRVPLRAHGLDLDQVRRDVNQLRLRARADDRDGDQLGPDANQLGRGLGARRARAGDARPPLDLVEGRLEQVDLRHGVDVGRDELALLRRGLVGRGVEDLHGRRRAVGGRDRLRLGDAEQDRVAELEVGGRRSDRVADREGGGGVDGRAQPVEALVLGQRGRRQVEQVVVGLEGVVLPPRVDVGGLDVLRGESLGVDAEALGDLLRKGGG